ncbi:hypothetical protein [Streptosporangium sp. NPDC002544]
MRALLLRVMLVGLVSAALGLVFGALTERSLIARPRNNRATATADTG